MLKILIVFPHDRSLDYQVIVMDVTEPAYEKARYLLDVDSNIHPFIYLEIGMCVYSNRK